MFTRSSFCIAPKVKPLTSGQIIFLFSRYYGRKTLPHVFKAWWMFPLAVTIASGKWQTTFEPEEEKVGILLPLGDKLHSGKQRAPELMQTCIEQQRIALICHSPHMELELINCVFSQWTWLWIPWTQEYWISEAQALISWRMVWHAGILPGNTPGTLVFLPTVTCNSISAIKGEASLINVFRLFVFSSE